MNKAFTKESDDAPDDALGFEEESPLPPGAKNYMTPAGARALRDELSGLTARLEAGLEGRERREAERRARAIERRFAIAEVVDPATQPKDRVLFGAAVTVRDEDDVTRTYHIVGVDEADAKQGRVSWLSPIARALSKCRVGDIATVKSPAGDRDVEIIALA